MDDWQVNLLLAVVLFAAILLPSAVSWAPATHRRPLRESDLDEPTPKDLGSDSAQHWDGGKGPEKRD